MPLNFCCFSVYRTEIDAILAIFKGGMVDIRQIAARAKKASIELAAVSAEAKNDALEKIARALEAGADDISAANQADIKDAEAQGLAAPLLKRLRFDRSKIQESCAGFKCFPYPDFTRPFRDRERCQSEKTETGYEYREHR